MKHTGEQAFETVIEAHLPANGYVSVDGDSFDRERAIFPETVLAFVRETQPKEWARLDSPSAANERRVRRHLGVHGHRDRRTECGAHPQRLDEFTRQISYNLHKVELQATFARQNLLLAEIARHSVR